jgi:hypothetical protein
MTTVPPSTMAPFVIPKVGLQHAYPISPETEDGDEVWVFPQRMTVTDVRACR